MSLSENRIPPRQSIRKIIILVSFLLFPVTVFYFSPYLIIMGAVTGAASLSLILFAGMFFFSLVTGRAFCSWICPAGGMQECVMTAVDKPVKGGRRNRIKFYIWVPWIFTIVYFFINAGGIKTVDPFIATTKGFSVADPYAYIIYIPVLMLILIPSLTAGRRGFCHYICWMAPFMIIGKRLGRLIRVPALRLKADAESCVDCGRCTRNCPMSLDVNQMVRSGSMFNDECILCGECADACRKNTISFNFSVEK